MPRRKIQPKAKREYLSFEVFSITTVPKWHRVPYPERNENHPLWPECKDALEANAAAWYETGSDLQRSLVAGLCLEFDVPLEEAS